MAEVWDDDGESAYERRKHRRSAATISITLICSEEWNRKVDLLNRAREASPLLSGEEGDRGKWFVCNERYGGNTLFLLYPYLHLTTEPFRIQDRLEDAMAFKDSLPKNFVAKLDQASYVEVDRISQYHRFDVSSAQHLIFIGLRLNHKSTQVSETSWRTWSKIEILTGSLMRNHIEIDAVSLLKQKEPKNTCLFMYCVLVKLKLEDKNDKLKCLNVLQKLRGSIIPGYVSLFECGTEDKDEELDRKTRYLLDSDGDRRRRRRSDKNNRRRRSTKRSKSM